MLMLWAMMALIGGLSSSSMVRAQDAPAPAPSAETGVAAEGAANTAPDAAVTTPSEAAADDALVVPLPEDKLNTGDTAWVLASAALVLLMTPGLGFFYGGFGALQEYAQHLVDVLWRDGRYGFGMGIFCLFDCLW